MLCLPTDANLLRPTNDTFVYGLDGFCPSGYSAASCITFRGGQYIPGTSSTSTTPGPPADAPWPFPRMTWVSDVLTLNGSVTLSEYPIGIAQNDWGSQGYHPQVGLGMGINSSLIYMLNVGGLIASRTWAISWGMMASLSEPNRQVDGSLVIGGYDRGRILGDGNEKAVVQLSAPSQACESGMVISISDIVLNF